MKPTALLLSFFTTISYFVSATSISVLDKVVQIPTTELITIEQQQNTHSSEQTFVVAELIPNGSFTDELNYWQPQGLVTRQANCFNSSSCVTLGDPTEPTMISSITQQLEMPVNQPATLLFKIKTESSETLSGFDSPYFTVLINNQPIYQEHFSPKLPLGNWRSVAVPLPVLSSGTHQLSFRQANTGDEQQVTIVSLSQITTKAALLGAENQLSFSTDVAGATINLELHTPTGQQQVSGTEVLTLTSTELADVTAISYWLELPDRASSKPRQTAVVTDLEPPNSSQIITSKFESDGQLTLNLTKPTDAYGYKINFSSLSEDSDQPNLIYPASTFTEQQIITSTVPSGASLDNFELITLDVAGNSSITKP